MQSSTHPASPMPHTATAPTTIQTTLYDLLTALNAEAEPGEEELVTAAAVHLLNAGRARFVGDRRVMKVVRS